MYVSFFSKTHRVTRSANAIMKQLTINATSREKMGTAHAKRLRRSGSIPAIIYGVHDTRHLTIPNADWQRLWREISGKAALIELNTEGDDTVFSIIQNVQRHPITDAFLHIDFKEIERGKPMTMSVNIHARGESFGVRNQGGVIEIQSFSVNIRCRPRHLPEFISVDVSELKINESIAIKDLPELEGVEYLDDPDQVVIACAGATAEPEDEEPEEEAAEGTEAAEQTEGESEE